MTATQQPSFLLLDAGFGYFSDAAGRVRRVALPDGKTIEELGSVTLPEGARSAPPLAVHAATAYVATSPSTDTFAIRGAAQRRRHANPLRGHARHANRDCR